MTWAVISTWKMSIEGAKKAAGILKAHGSAVEAAIAGVQDVEDNPSFHSVGMGGLPDEDGRVLLDGGFMDGDTLHFGAVGALEGYRSPAAIAMSLSHETECNFLVGEGAARYADAHGFQKRNNLTAESKQRFLSCRRSETLKAYSGHDTVCFLALDEKGSLAVSTSTSGLFLKRAGRIGDTPLPGTGYYADSKVGASAATGMGEEIMKGALSYAVVDRMANGMPVQQAVYDALHHLDSTLRDRNGHCGAISLIALDRFGNHAAASNVPFPFVCSEKDGAVLLYLLDPEEGTVPILINDPDHLELD